MPAPGDIAARTNAPRLNGPPAGLLGREPELEQLRHGLKASLEGEGRLFVISGDPGIGKTTLARVFADSASDAGVVTAWGRCWESGGAPPLWPWTQVLRTHLGSPDLAGVVEELGDRGATIARLVAGVGDIESEEPHELTESERARFAVFDSVAGYLQLASGRTPLLVILEDMHAADLSSLLMLKLVARQIAGVRGVVVATYRRGEARKVPEVMRELVEVAREGEELDLRGLDRKSLGRLIERVGGSRPSEATVERIASLTGGNPLFAGELGRVLSRDPALATNGAAPGSGPATLPDTIRETLARRVAQLSEPARRLLEIGSVIGTEFDAQIVAGLLPPEMDASALIAQVEDEALLEPVPSAVGHFRFSHGLLRDALYEGLSQRRRAQLHAEVGDALDRIGGDAHLAEVAHHFTEALKHGIPSRDAAERAFERTVAAAERAHRLLAFEDAVALYERALGMVAPAEVNERRRTEVLITLGVARLAAGRTDEAVAALGDAAAIARRLEAWDLLARAAIGLGQRLTGGVIHHDWIALIEEAIEHLPPGANDERALLLARLGLELITHPDKERRHAVVRDAVDVARQSGTMRTLAAALDAKAFGLHLPEAVEESLEAATELREVGWRLEDPGIRAAAHAVRLQGLLQLGRADEFHAEIADLERAAHASRQPLHIWSAHLVCATRHTMRGEFDAAEVRSRAAVEAGGSIPGVQPAYFNQMFALAFHRGGLAQIEGVVRGLADQIPRYRSMWSAALALILAESGRHDEVQQELSIVTSELDALMGGPAALPSLAWAAEACRLAAAPEAAAPLHDALVPFADLHISLLARAPASYWGSVRLWLGKLCALTGRVEDASGHLQQALDADRRFGATPFIAHSETALARRLLARREDGDLDSAATLLASASAAAERLGMGPLLAEIRELRDAAGAPDGGESAAREFRLEGEFWTIAYEGTVSRFKDAKGFRYLAVLLRSPGREHHVLDLVAATDGRAVAPQREAAAREAGLHGPTDAGHVLDPSAKAAYRGRLEELREDLEQAESWGDSERAAKAREEIDFLEHELARAFGLGGRERRERSPTEQIRINVTKAIRAALQKVDQANPTLGRHFRDTVQTGTFCSYGEPGEPLPAWRLD